MNEPTKPKGKHTKLKEPEVKPFNPNPRINYEMIKSLNGMNGFIINILEELGLVYKEQKGNQKGWRTNSSKIEKLRRLLEDK